MKNNLNIRLLTADEIDCRIGQVSKNATHSASILLYKNARVDMAILDELVGPENWQRDHKEIKGNLYCGVGLNTATGWVWKWDCGTESNTEKEKGEASDSFKRACVNWGIGRELYTAPRIWIPLNDKEYNDGRPFVDFRVAKIEYNESREICDLVIVDQNDAIRFDLNAKKRAHSAPLKAETSKDTTASVDAPKTSANRVVTLAAVKAGRADRLINNLAEYDPADSASWTAGIGAMRYNNGNELEFKSDAMEEILARAKAVRASKYNA